MTRSVSRTCRPPLTCCFDRRRPCSVSCGWDQRSDSRSSESVRRRRVMPVWFQWESVGTEVRCHLSRLSHAQVFECTRVQGGRAAALCTEPPTQSCHVHNPGRDSPHQAPVATDDTHEPSHLTTDTRRRTLVGSTGQRRAVEQQRARAIVCSPDADSLRRHSVSTCCAAAVRPHRAASSASAASVCTGRATHGKAMLAGRAGIHPACTRDSHRSLCVLRHACFLPAADGGATEAEVQRVSGGPAGR